MIFFLTLTVRGPFHRKDFNLSGKNMGVYTRLRSEKTVKFCMQNLKKKCTTL